MADHSLPTNTSTYVNYTTQIDGRFDDLALNLDSALTTPTNLPLNSIRWNSTTLKHERLTSISPVTWTAFTRYDININGTVGATTPNTGAFTTLSSTGNTTIGDASGDTLTVNATPTFVVPVPAASGGTGQSSYAVGDIVFASTTTALSKLADVATGNALISGGVGVAPAYGKIGLTTHVSGTLPTANGGTNLTAFTSGGAVYATSTSALTTGTLPATSGGTGFASYAIGDLVFASTTTALSKLADVATGNALISGGVGTAPSYGKIGLTTHVSGSLPAANGGTGTTTSTGTGNNVLSNNATLLNANLTGDSTIGAASCQISVTSSYITQTIDSNTGQFFWQDVSGPTSLMSLDAFNGLQVTTSIVTSSLVKASSGSSTNTAFGPNGDNNTGMFFPATDSLGLSTNGTERMRINTFGEIGIGTTSPNGKLHVSDASNSIIRASTSAVTGGAVGRLVASYTGGGGGTASELRLDAADGLTFIYTSTSTPIRIGANSAEAMRIYPSTGISVGNTTDSGSGSLNVSGSLSGGYTDPGTVITAMGFATKNVVRVVPTVSATYTTTVPAAGAICVLSLLTTGTTSRTITFGTGFKTTGTLATGSVASRYFNITFVSDGTFLIETSRTTAIT